MVLMFWNVSEGQVVESVAGVKFGIEKKSAIIQLVERFGNFYDEDLEEVTFYAVTIGGINYDVAHFCFKNNIFVRADFYSHYELSEIEKAKQKRNEISSIYNKKYNNSHFDMIDDLGFKIDCYGDSFYEGDDYNPILIRINKWKTKFGSYCYYVFVSYYNYLKNSLDDI